MFWKPNTVPVQVYRYPNIVNFLSACDQIQNLNYCLPTTSTVNLFGRKGASNTMLWIHTGFNANPDPISEFGYGTVLGFDQKWENFTAKKSSFQKNVKLLFIYPQAPMKEIQAKEEAFSPRKENIQHLKTSKIKHFYYFCGSYLPSRVRIWIHTCGSGSTTLLK